MLSPPNKHCCWSFHSPLCHAFYRCIYLPEIDEGSSVYCIHLISCSSEYCHSMHKCENFKYGKFDSHRHPRVSIKKKKRMALLNFWCQSVSWTLPVYITYSDVMSHLSTYLLYYLNQRQKKSSCSLLRIRNSRINRRKIYNCIKNTTIFPS